MPDAVSERATPPQWVAWKWGWLVFAVVSLVPVAYYAYSDTLETVRVARVRLIEQYRLWETAPDYAGTPQAWTRFAAWLLDTDQLMERVRMQQGALAEEIEVDFRRDLVLAGGKTIGAYLLLWFAPLALVYGAGRLYRRRRSR